VCGGSGVTLDFLAFSGLVYLGVWYQLANIVGYAAGTLLSFFLNRAITFGVYDAPVRRFLSFAGVAVVGYVISSAVLWLLVERLGIHPMVAKIMTLFVVLATQFSLNTLITFRQGVKVDPSRGVRS
jgi:putative flippase GtrA